MRKIYKRKSKNNKKKTWTDERREAHSKIMRKVVLENPKSYSCSNVNGKTKFALYKGFKLN